MLDLETTSEVITNKDFQNLAIDIIENRINELEGQISTLELQKIMQGLHKWEQGRLEHMKDNLKININFMKTLNPQYRIRN